MRIVLTVPSLDRVFGGPARKAPELASALRTRGHQVRLFGAGNPAGFESGAEGLGVRGRFHATPVPARTGPLRRAIAGAEIVHVLGFRDPVGTTAALAARRHSVPMIFEPVGMLEPRVRSATLKRTFDISVGHLVVAGASLVVAASAVEAADLATAGIERGRVRVRPNGVDFARLLPLPARGPLRSRLGIPLDAPLVVTLARIGAIKGLVDMAHAVDGIPGVHWLLAGPNERDGTLTRTRAVSPRERTTICVDGLWSEDARAALAEADLLCVPSAYESFGTVAAEAAGCGVPVVITDRCGAKGVLGDVAHLVPAGDPTALRVVIAQILTDLPAARAAAESAAAAIREALSWGRLATVQTEIYDAARRMLR